MASSITLKNLLAVFGFAISALGLPLSVWWLMGDLTNREPIVGIVLSFGGLIFTFLNIDWRDIIQTGCEHDVALFRRIETILPEPTISFIRDSIMSVQMRTEAELKQCDDFEHFCALEGNRFISARLEKSKQRLFQAVDELGRYTSVHFFYVQGRYRLYPELMTELESGNLEADRRFDRHNTELDRLTSELTNAYVEFRKAIKQKLKI